MAKSREQRPEAPSETDTVRREPNHPSKSLEARRKGFGIGGGYERPLRRKSEACPGGLYGPLPHAGYYGSGSPATRFGIGQAGFSEEAKWFEEQFGERTSAGSLGNEDQ